MSVETGSAVARQKARGRLPVGKVLAVALPLVITTVLWGLSKTREETDWPGLTFATGSSQLLSLYSIVLMAIALLITVRSRVVEGIYGGLDKSYKLHARLGEIALTLMLIHLLALIPDTRERLALFVPFVGAWWKTVATIAIYIFAAQAVMVYLKSLSYQTWLNVHKWMGVPFVLAGVHAIAAFSDIRDYEPLRTWMLLCIAIGTVAWTYRTFFYKAMGPRYDYVVAGIADHGNDMWDLSLRPTDVRMNFEPGKFAFISVKNVQGIAPEHHPFSISSSPVLRELRISFKVLGDYTKTLTAVPKGAAVEVYGPFGQFTLHQLGEHRRLLLIGGGIGVTPFLSMLAFEATNDDFRRLWLFYAVRREQDAVYHAEIENQIASADSYVDYVKWLSDERGKLTADEIIRITGPIDDYAIMICGPQAMALALRRQFIARGIRPNRIVYEDFAFR
ncbi:MAG: ferric reductase-like transmembrane domain-containing protein [Betaproteobacteria bacterium]